MNHTWTRAALLGLAFVIAVAYFAFNYLPSQAHLNSRQVLLDQHQQLVSHATSIPMEVTHVKQQIAVTKEFCARWRQRLAPEHQLPSRFTAIVKLAESHGLRVMDFDPGESTKSAGITHAPLNLTVETSFPKLVKFLAAVEQMQSVTWAKQTIIGASEKGEGSLTCKATFVVFAKNSEFSDDVKHAPHPIP